MAMNMVKFERGQVWRVEPENPLLSKEKDRLWLVLSAGIYNTLAGEITMVPVVSQDVSRMPAQVLFENDQHKNSVVCCERIRSFNNRTGECRFTYVSTLSAALMEKVDVAISIHLGMHYSPITLNKLYSSMEAIVRSIKHLQDKDSAGVFTDDDVLEFAEKLQMLAGTAEPTATEIPEAPVMEPPRPYRKRTHWTLESCDEFLKDAEERPMREVMAKWNISRKSSYFSTRNYVLGVRERLTQNK